MDKENKLCTNTHEYYLAIKKKEILPFATTQTDFEGIMLSIVGQTERQILSELTYMWNLKEKKPKITDTENRLVAARGGGGGGIKSESGEKVQTSSCKINQSGDVIYGMVTRVNHTVLCIWSC